jgi:tRNA(Ile)-lysidine synthase
MHVQAAPLALVVDHQLRPESTAEAEQVAEHAKDLGLHARVLQIQWPGGGPRHQDKMTAARIARYKVLAQACQEAGKSHLLLAHHADDQAETFLLRAVHASGIRGLAGMPLFTPPQTPGEKFGRDAICGNFSHGT